MRKVHSNSLRLVFDSMQICLPAYPAVTDVAGEMHALTDTLRDCKTCHKACVAAVEMLVVRKRVLPMVVAKDQIIV